ncbi:phosphotransferase family protein [Rhodococcoides corynebacterioides]|uniref:phosphotransferase family protein n=1 Tax=Rhodococcoides corynebacterioides TaxID=53972 RepID=UPI00083323F8|nr:phosphotransferase family protein [Rhodococcus corynebacterioides]
MTLDTAALAEFLRDNGITVAGELRVDRISGGRSNLTYRVDDDESSWIVRRPPTSGLTPSAHDMAREWAVTSAVQSTDVPVAATVAFDPDGRVLGAPMTVVEFVPGRVVRTADDLRTLTDAEVAANATELVRVLAALHAVDHRAIGLSEFGRPDGFVARQVATWGRQWQRVKTRDLADIDRLQAVLAETVPMRSDAAIVHGDFRVDNVILDTSDAGRVAAVVDWEMSTLGDPITDVALLCAYRRPIFDTVLGVPAAAWTSSRYPSADALAEEYATFSGRDLGDWPFYLALANFKIAVIAEGITHRALADGGTDDSATAAAEATAEFAAAGLQALTGVSR